jgi:hypothetical protein
MLDPSLVNLPAAVHYKGATDALGQPPAGAVAGDLYIVLYAGTVDASWGSPAAGTACKPGDWLVKNNAGQWQLIPIQTAGTVTEAPTDGGYYARQNSGWSDIKTAFVQKAGDQMTGQLGLRYAPKVAASSLLWTAGDISVIEAQPALMFNSYYTSGWKTGLAGYSGAIKYDTTTGQLQFSTSATSQAADAVSDIVYRGCFDKFGGFNVGTVGGDYGVNWVGVFRRDQDAITMLGVVNGDTTVSAQATVRMITGTGNSFWSLTVADNAGAPFAETDYGSAIHSWRVNFGGTEVQRLLPDGTLGIKCVPVAGTNAPLQVYGDIGLVNGSCNIGFNAYYQGGWHTFNAGAPLIAAWQGANNFLSFFGQQTAGSGPGPTPGIYEFMRILPNVLGGNPQLRIGASGVDMSRSYPALLQLSFDSNVSGDGMACMTPRVGGTAIQFQTSWTTVAGSIVPNGSSTSYGTSSDARLKTNIADAPDAGAIIDAIRVRQFDWRGDGAHVAFGMIAQELANHCPDAVLPPNPQKDADDALSNPWMTDNAKLVPLLIREIQSLRARVAKLEMPA